MASTTASSLTEGLKAKLNSSLPLEARCRLATNVITCRVAVPHREDLVLDWAISSLRKKYLRQCEGQRKDEEMLWQCLASCLPKLPPTLDYSNVPDFLLDVVGLADMSLPEVVGSITLLLPLGCRAYPASPSWPPTITLLLKQPSLVKPAMSALASLNLLAGIGMAPLLSRLSIVAAENADLQADAGIIAQKLLFSSPSALSTLFTHLTTEELEEKHSEPSTEASLLLACLEQGTDPRLLAEASKDLLPAVRLPLLALYSLMCGGPGPLRARTAIGAKLESAATPCTKRLAAVLASSLPLDLSVEVHSSLSAGKLLQDIVRHCLDKAGAGEDAGAMVAVLRVHHPQLLEPLLPTILTAYLRHPVDPPSSIFSDMLEVMLALRQVPKLVARLFLHLRTLDIIEEINWREGDLEALAKILPSLPRVQTLEMWKMMNFHLSSDCLAAPPNSVKVGSFCRLLGPLLSTLLSHSQLADHNLPSSLMPRISALMLDTVSSMQAILDLGFVPEPQRSLLCSVVSALASLVGLFKSYRNVESLASVFELQDKVVTWLLDNPEWSKETPGAERILQNCYKPGLELKQLKLSENAITAANWLPHSFDELSDEVLLRWVRKRSEVPSSLLDNPKCCAIVLMEMLERVNKGSEELYIPSPEMWTRQEYWMDRDSYLGKSLASTLVTMLHSEAPCTALASSDFSRLEALPLEHLPSALKLAAVLVTLSQVLKTKHGVKYQSLAARCLESSDAFRFVDAGAFLARLLMLEELGTGELMEAVTRMVGKYTKTIQDVTASFHLWEGAGVEEGCKWVKAAVGLLESLKPATKGVEEGEKRLAAELLVDKLCKFVVKIWKKLNTDDIKLTSLLFLASAQLIAVLGLKVGSKASKMVASLADLALSSAPIPGWSTLLTSCCSQPSLLEQVDNWRDRCWTLVSKEFCPKNKELVVSLLASTSNPDVLESMLMLVEGEAPNVSLWTEVLRAEVSDTCKDAKNKSVEAALVVILREAGRSDTKVDLCLLPPLLDALFSAPPCISSQMETLALACLALVPLVNTTPSLATLSLFLSHRTGLSNQTIPVVLALLRHLLPSTTSNEELQALAGVLGLVSRQRDHWGSVSATLTADLLAHMSKLEPSSRAVLTSALMPLLPFLDKHDMELLSSSLDPATNELFKQLLTNYNSNHKFKGKI